MVVQTKNDITNKKMNFYEKFRSKPLYKRLEIAENAIMKCPDRIPVIVDQGEKKDPNISKHQFLCPLNDSIGTLFCFIRQHVQILPEESLFFFTNRRTLISGSSLVAEIYEQHKSKDKFLYIFYTRENVFG